MRTTLSPRKGQKFRKTSGGKSTGRIAIAAVNFCRFEAKPENKSPYEGFYFLFTSTIAEKCCLGLNRDMDIEEQPAWKAGIEKTSFPKLEENLKCDVAIVGGGLAGILNAYLLAKSGKDVILLEKDKIGSGATEYTTAFITQDVDTEFAELIKLFGNDSARLIWQSGADAIDLIERIIKEEKIDCEFMRTSLYTYANTSKQFEDLKEEQKTISEFGFDASPPRADGALNFSNSGYFEIPNQAKFHPLKFLYALSDVVVKMGVKIYEQSEVTGIEHGETGITVRANEHQLDAEQVVVATYQPFHNRIRLFLKRGMYRSYVLEARLPKRLIKEGMYLDTENPYHYFRIDPAADYDRIILGGEDVKSIFKINHEKSFAALEEYLGKILHGVEYTITRKWIGPILEPSDGIALIGETSENEFVATAFSGNGMTYSAISAMFINDLILGRENAYAKVYDPKRIPTIKNLFIKGGDYIDEFIGGAAKNIFKKSESTESGA